jgi:hypothetical protein
MYLGFFLVPSCRHEPSRLPEILRWRPLAEELQWWKEFQRAGNRVANITTEFDLVSAYASHFSQRTREMGTPVLGCVDEIKIVLNSVS